MMMFGLLFVQATDPHAGQPQSCSNDRKAEHKCECDRASACPAPGKDGKAEIAEPGSKCQTYCRPEACKCKGMCSTMNHHPMADRFKGQ